MQVHNSPQDIFDWPETVHITNLTMDPRGGLSFTFDRAFPESWKWFSNPALPAENFQFTVWAVVQNAHAAGFVQFWQGRPMGDGSLPPILSGYKNWWGDVRHLWGEMSDYVPQAGDTVGFFVSAGNARLIDGVSSVRERSNIVTVKLPEGDQGSFDFVQFVPAPPPEPVPTPAPPTFDAQAAFLQLREDFEALGRQEGDDTEKILTAIAELRQEAIDQGKTIGKQIAALAADGLFGSIFGKK